MTKKKDELVETARKAGTHPIVMEVAIYLNLILTAFVLYMIASR